MTNLIFGAVWTGIVLLITFPVLAEGEIFAAIFLIPFWIVGVVLLKSGYKEVKTNKETETLGEEGYGVITDIYETGTYVNDIPELKAEVSAYIPSLQQTIAVSEKIGLAHKAREYDIGTYVLLKYYNGDINIIYSIDDVMLPADAKLALGNLVPKQTLSEETIVINGVEYVKKK